MKQRRFLAIIAVLALLITMLPAGSTRGTAAHAADGPVLKLHYHRNDNNYDDWDVWLWEYGKDGAGYAFADEGGEKVATMNVTPGVTSVGFIVRTSSWGKDVNEDQFIDIAEVVSGTVHIYVESQVKGYTKDYGEDAVVGLKVKNVAYNNDKTVTVKMTGDMENTAGAFTVIDKSAEREIDQIAVTKEEGKGVYTVILTEELDLAGYYVLTFDGNEYKITLPDYYSTELFEQQFTYTGSDLGANWSKEATTFRLWAPTATEASVNLYESGDEGAGDLLKNITMDKAENGTWTVTEKGDLNGTYYTYSVMVNGESVEAIDPYARTAGANGKRAMVIDLRSTDPAGWENDKNPHAGEGINDAIIYEGHIRDLTVNPEGNIPNKGKYIALTATGTKTLGGSATGLDYLKELGITHLHILPMYDFGSVDENSAINKYNWGYDPVNYNVPEGSYATDAKNGAVRVGEVKQMVQALHESGISVVMDVVYNHVYSAKEFCINQLVPGYFSRKTETGAYSNGSGCGNDTATERSMVRKYIVDSVNYWADEYHIDGFRFDLVGLIDVDTVNEIVETVHRNHPDVIFYGEGWSMTTLPTKENVTLATQPNSNLTPGFAYFNDTIRDGLKGSVFDKGPGFISGAAGMNSKIERCFIGNDNWCSSPSQTINYASCHDNNTLFDRIRMTKKDLPEETAIKMNNLAAAIYMTAEGTPFMASGEEILRSKTNKDGTYNENSYNAGDTVNTIKWANLDDPKYAENLEYYKGLIAFRKAHGALRLSDAADVAAHVTTLKDLDSKMVGFLVSGGVNGETAEEICLLFNSSEDAVKVTLPEGSWTVCVQGNKAGTASLGEVSGEVSVDGISALILTKGDKPSDNGDKSEAQKDGKADSEGSAAKSGEEGKTTTKGAIALWGTVAAALVATVLIKRGKDKKQKQNQGK